MDREQFVEQLQHSRSTVGGTVYSTVVRTVIDLLYFFVLHRCRMKLFNLIGSFVLCVNARRCGQTVFGCIVNLVEHFNKICQRLSTP